MRLILPYSFFEWTEPAHVFNFKLFLNQLEARLRAEGAQINLLFGSDSNKKPEHKARVFVFEG